jgi:hypothetical protein
MTSDRKPGENLYQYILRAAQERRQNSGQWSEDQIRRIEQRAQTTHGNPQTRR